jgi:hypothetical protein
MPSLQEFNKDSSDVHAQLPKLVRLSTSTMNKNLLLGRHATIRKRKEQHKRKTLYEIISTGFPTHGRTQLGSLVDSKFS